MGTESEASSIVSLDDSFERARNKSDQEVIGANTSLAYVNTMDPTKEEARLVEILSRNFGKFLSTERAQEALKSATDESFQAINQRAEVLEKRCDKIEQDVKKVSHGAGGKMNQLMREIDDIKQAQRNMTVRVTGISSTVSNNDLANAIVTLANEKMKIKMQKSHIKAAFWVSSKDKEGKKTSQVIVKFVNEEAKRDFYLARTKLKGVTPAIYINEDLTPLKAKLAAAARKAVKEKKILNTWTLDGIVYAKYQDIDKPKKIDKISDLEGVPSTSQTYEVAEEMEHSGPYVF